LTHFLKIYAGVHVTTTYIRKLLESDVVQNGTAEDRKSICFLYILYICLTLCCILEAAMHTAQQHSAETARLFYQIDVS